MVLIMSLSEKAAGYKTNWYDGWIFANFVDVMTETVLNLNKTVRKYIADNTDVLDIGCGTGSLAISLSDKCKSVKGIDVSPRMIRYAQKHNKLSNVEFSLVQKKIILSGVFKQKFDYAILKMVLHEIPEEERINLINEAKNISNQMIIFDWVAPQPKYAGINTLIAEISALREHFMNFRQWQIKGGLDGFLKRHGLKVVQEELFKNKTGKIARVNWQ